MSQATYRQRRDHLRSGNKNFKSANLADIKSKAPPKVTPKQTPVSHFTPPQGAAVDAEVTNKDMKSTTTAKKSTESKSDAPKKRGRKKKSESTDE